MVAKGGGGKATGEHSLLVKVGKSELFRSESLKVVDVQIFVPFSFGEPQHRDFHPFDLFRGNAANFPSCD